MHGELTLNRIRAVAGKKESVAQIFLICFGLQGQ